jgi:hypothetical protein
MVELYRGNPHATLVSSVAEKIIVIAGTISM